jgi:tetratricopeptide (TPR) repeat protein
MNGLNFTFLVFALGILISACSSFDRSADGMRDSSTETNQRNINGVFGNEADRAPAAFNPPSGTSADPNIDGTYLRTQADYHFTLGETYALAGDTDRAIEEFNLVLVYDPKAHVVHMKLAAEYIKKGKISNALENAKKSVELNPEAIEARILFGGLLAAIKLYDKAIEQYEAVLKADPKNVETSLYLGALYAEKGELKKALKVFDDLGKSSPESKHLAEYYVGRLYQQEQNSDLAIKHYQKSLAVAPDFEDALMALAEAYGAKDQSAAAIKLLETFQGKYGPSEKVAQELSQYYIKTEQYDKALKQFEVVLAHDPSNMNVRIRMAWIQILQKNYEPAEKNLLAVLEQAPDSDRVRLYLGSVYEETGKNQKAVEQFLAIPVHSSYYSEARIHAAYLNRLEGNHKKAAEIIKEGIRFRPEVSQMYAMYASILDELRQYKEAINMLDGAIKKFPQDEQLNFILGSLYDKVGDKTKTVEKMKFVIELNSDHVQALNYLAFTYAEMGVELEYAKDLAYKALRLKPEDGYIQDTLGWIYFKRGEYNEAIKVLEVAFQLKPDESVIADHLGDAYYQANMVDRAIKMYRKAVSFEKDRDTLRKIQAKIDAIEKASGRKTASE